MADRVVSILEKMEQSLEDKDFEAFRTQADSLVAAYDEHRPDERQFVEKAKVLSREKSPDRFDGQFDDLNAVSRFLVRVQEVKLNRTGALVGLGAGIPNDTGDYELRSFVTDLREKEETLATARRAAEAEVSSVSLPGLPRVYTVTVEEEEPILTGQEATLTVTTGNAGDEAVTDLGVDVAVSDDVEIDETTRPVSLDAGETKQSLFSIRPTSAGEQQISATLTVGENEFVETTIVEVLDPADVLERALERLQTLRERIESADVHKGGRRRLTSSIDAAIASQERASAALSNGESDEVSSHLETEINQLGALLNKLASADGQKGKGGRKGAAGAFSAKTRSGYRSITEDVIDLLSRVRKGQREN